MNNPALHLLLDAMSQQDKKARVCEIAVASLVVIAIVLLIKSKGAIK